MATEAATFALASAAHFATSFTDAAIPELLIAAVLGLGSSAVLSQRQHARGTAAGTTSFATLGTIVGLTIIATGRQDAPDLAYHATILTALVATLIAQWRQRDAARRPTTRSRPPGCDDDAFEALTGQHRPNRPPPTPWTNQTRAHHG